MLLISGFIVCLAGVAMFWFNRAGGVVVVIIGFFILIAGGRLESRGEIMEEKFLKTNLNYKNLGNIAIEGGYIVILRDHCGDLKAVFFKSVPPSEFIKIKDERNPYLSVVASTGTNKS